MTSPLFRKLMAKANEIRVREGVSPLAASTRACRYYGANPADYIAKMTSVFGRRGAAVKQQKAEAKKARLEADIAEAHWLEREVRRDNLRSDP